MSRPRLRGTEREWLRASPGVGWETEIQARSAAGGPRSFENASVVVVPVVKPWQGPAWDLRYVASQWVSEIKHVAAMTALTHKGGSSMRATGSSSILDQVAQNHTMA